MGDKEVQSSANINESIITASRLGHTYAVRQFLDDKDCNPATHHNLAFREACSMNHIEIVTLLLNDKRVNPSANNNEAIRVASGYGYYKLVKLLLQHSVKPTTEALQYATDYKQTDVVFLLEQEIVFRCKA